MAIKNLFEWHTFYLYATIFIVHINSFTIGVAFCWSTPVTPKLELKNTTTLEFPLSVNEISWLASLISLGTVFGAFIGGYLADLVGRKKILVHTAALATLSFLILALSHQLHMYYIARFSGGICIGIYLIVVPTYIAEITGNVETFKYLTKLFTVSGNLFCFGVGPFASVRTFSLSCIVFPVLFLIFGTILIPESPYFFIKQGRHEEAKACLNKFKRGNVENEMVQIETAVEKSLKLLDILKTKHFFQGLAISLTLTIIQQLTAFSAILLYIHHIFEDANTYLSKEISTILIGIVQVIASFSSHIIFQKHERKPLELVSTVATSISLIVLSIYFYLLIRIDVTSITWLPVAALIVYIFFYNVGMGPIPTMILGDIFPPNVKLLATSMTVACCFTFSFIITKIFPILVDLFNNWFVFLIFGILNGMSIIFVWRRVPETKGKTLVDIFEAE